MHSEMMKGFGGVDGAPHATVREVVAVGKELGVSAAQVALAWLRYRPVPVIPIIGARKLAQVEDNLAQRERDAFAGTTRAAGQSQRRFAGFPARFPGDAASAFVRHRGFGGSDQGAVIEVSAKYLRRSEEADEKMNRYSEHSARMIDWSLGMLV